MIGGFTKARAEALLRKCVDSGTVILTKHAIDEMAADMISRAELYTVLRNGHIYMEPEQDIKTAEWKYRVEGTAAGQSIAAVFKFREINQAIVITVFEVN